MANFTEQAIDEAFIKLLSDRPLDKITVADIANECGINRNTFYYHYHDIYELADSIFKKQEAKINAENPAEVPDERALIEGFSRAIGFALDHKQAIVNIYHSVNRDSLNNYLWKASERSIEPFVSHQARVIEEAKGQRISQDIVNSVVFLYACMLQGVVVNIVTSDLFDQADRILDDAMSALSGTVTLSLLNLCDAS